MPLATSCYGSTFRLCVTSASWSGHGLFANKRYVLPSPWVTRDVLYAQRWIMYFPKLCTKTLPAYPELALFRVNPGSTTTPNRFPLTLSGVVFVLQRWRRSFSLSFGKPTQTLKHTLVCSWKSWKTRPLICLSVCVCVHWVREEENFTFHWRSRPCWCGAAHRSWGAVCTTSAPLEVDDDDGRWWWQSYDIDWVGWNRENSIFPAALPATVNPGAVFCCHYSTLYGYNFYNFGFSTAAGGRHICNICRSSLKLFFSLSYFCVYFFLKLKLRNHFSILPSWTIFGHLVVGCTCTKNRNLHVKRKICDFFFFSRHRFP